MPETVIITGASRGIGRAAALLFGKNGYNVIVNYSSSSDKAEEVCSEINSSGGCAYPFKADVSDRAAVDRMTAFAAEKFGGADILVNNAGVDAGGMIPDTNEMQYDKTVETNLNVSAS